MRVWSSTVGFGNGDRVGNNAADEAADCGRRRMLGVTFLVFAVGGILLFWNCIGSSLPYDGGSEGTALDRSSGLVCWCFSQEA